MIRTKLVEGVGDVCEMNHNVCFGDMWEKIQIKYIGEKHVVLA